MQIFFHTLKKIITIILWPIIYYICDPLYDTNLNELYILQKKATKYIYINLSPTIHLISFSLITLFPKDVKNYRPMSVLPVFPKIYKTSIKSHLLSFIKQNNIIHAYQFGFSRKSSLPRTKQHSSIQLCTA